MTPTERLVHSCRSLFKHADGFRDDEDEFPEMRAALAAYDSEQAEALLPITDEWFASVAEIEHGCLSMEFDYLDTMIYCNKESWLSLRVHLRSQRIELLIRSFIGYGEIGVCLRECANRGVMLQLIEALGIEQKWRC